LAQNPLVKRVITIFDKNKDGKISFAEFLEGLGALYGCIFFILIKKQTTKTKLNSHLKFMILMKMDLLAMENYLKFLFY
jgi:Ca2+-binding EF-hand superfamily protein